MQPVSNPFPAVENEENGLWPVRRHKILDWLINETRNQRFIDNIWVEMCERLQASGVPVARATMHFRTLHPQWLGARILWRPGLQEAKITTFGYGVETTSQFLNSPINEIFSGGREVRQSLEGEVASYPLYGELQGEGLTDYVAWPMEHTLGKRHVITFSSDTPGGFKEDHLIFLKDLLPALTLAHRNPDQEHSCPNAAGDLCRAACQRADSCRRHDPRQRRNSRRSDPHLRLARLRRRSPILWPRDDVIELLNAYFDAMSEPIEKHGGEILKFMGDGLLRHISADRSGCLHQSSAGDQGSASGNDRARSLQRGKGTCGAALWRRRACGGCLLRQYRLARSARFHRHRPGRQHCIAAGKPDQGN